MPGWLRAIGFPVLLAALATPARGEPWERLQVHGFASQGAVKTTANRFFGDSENISFDFTEIGVNASYRANPRLLVAGQILARRAGEMYDGTPSLDYALADITLDASARRILGLRLGRFKNDLGLYNATRDVPFTRPSIFLPQSVYYDRVRNLMLSSDGLAAYGAYYGDAGHLSLTLAGGWPVIDENVEWAYLGNDFPGEIRANEIVWTGSLWCTVLDERLKVGLSAATLAMRFDPDVGSGVAAGTTELIYGIASLQYYTQHVTLSAEYGRQPLEWEGYGPLFPDQKRTGEGYYLQSAFRVFPNFEVMLRYEEGFADRNDRRGSNDFPVISGLLPNHVYYFKAGTLGLRWDLNPHVMLRADYQINSGTFTLSNRENPDPFASGANWNAVAIEIAVRF